MFFSVSTTHRPATDLGFLLHKNPARIHSADMPFGRAFVFYPEATDERCTAVLGLDVDPVGMVRGKAENGRWDEYVNDRPYAASSFISSAMTEFFSTAMSGRSKERPELAATPIPLEFHLPVLKVRGGEPFLRSLFEPLGYDVELKSLAGQTSTPYFDVRLRRTGLLNESLTHLYVLIPVLDDDKHYWVARDEIDKLLLRGGDWLPRHPAKEAIAFRYLQRQHQLARIALERLTVDDGDPDPDAASEEALAEPNDKQVSLHRMRLEAVRDVLLELGAKRVLDLGCGEGKLVRMLLASPKISEVVGVDVSVRTLEKAARMLRIEQMSDRKLSRVKLVHGSLTYRDANWEGFDAAALVEVIEHLDPARLNALERVVFEHAKPRAVVLTTPNREYNALFEGMPSDTLRHSDHRFEWTREEFRIWSEGISERFGYAVEITAIGPVDEAHGAPSQMAVFRR